MTGAMVVVENGTPTQPLVAMLIQLMFLLVVLKMAPYNDDLDDWSSFVCSLALTLTTLGGFLLMISKQRSEDPVISVELLTTFLIGINGLCFAYEMLVIGYVACQDRLTAARLKKTRKKENSNNNVPTTKVLPVSEVVKQGDTDDDAEKQVRKFSVEDKKINEELKSWGRKQQSSTIVVVETVSSPPVVRGAPSVDVLTRKQLRQIKKDFGTQSKEYKAALSKMGLQRKATKQKQ